MLKEYLCDISYNRGMNDGILLHKILEFLVYTVMCISLGISPLYVLNGQIHNAVLLYKSASMLQPSLFYFTIDCSFGMRYCMILYLIWYRNYAWSNLELLNLLHKKQTPNFDHAQFLCQLRQKLLQYLILKLQSMVKQYNKDQSMLALLKTAL